MRRVRIAELPETVHWVTQSSLLRWKRYSSERNVLVRLDFLGLIASLLGQLYLNRIVKDPCAVGLLSDDFA